MRPLIKTCLYIHGFNSSGQATKAQLLKTYLESLNIPVLTPNLRHDPSIALQTLEQLLAPYDDSEVAIVGSSLGGFYANYVVRERPNTKVVLVNPAMRPWEVSKILNGEFINPVTGEKFIINKEKADELKQYAIKGIPRQGQFLLLLQLDDEMLDYRVARAQFPDSQTQLYTGGSHAFTNFEAVLPDIARFFQVGKGQ